MGDENRTDAVTLRARTEDMMATERSEVREVLVSLMTGWRRVKSSKLARGGWLHYELPDGTTGLAQPKHWRIVDAVTGEPVPLQPR